MVNSTRSRKW